MQTTRPLALPLDTPGRSVQLNDLTTAMEAIIGRHGSRRVLLAALGVLLTGRKRKLRQIPAAELSAHLRRDIGLGPAQTAPPLVELMR
ncbi:hypothetical protein [Oceanicola sp. S124]|uniref:hypothetical protein n=1 Tax=Oceanicola sp. S124 TaxID=1042378 RepID=UPI000255A699|nr:hypothetical protein [Oceanicola sp. S124]